MAPKFIEKLIVSEVSFGSYFFSRLGAPLDALGQPSGPLGAILGGLKSEKMRTVLCENHFFENSLFRFLEPLLALLGSSWRLLGRSWAQTGSQKGLKSEKFRLSYAKTTFLKIVFFASWSSCWPSWAPLGASWADLGPKLAPKMAPKAPPKLVTKLVQKQGQFLAVFLSNFEASFGPQNLFLRELHFSRFSGVAPDGLSWAYLSPFWPVLAPSWRHLGPILARLGSSWRPLGAILVPSWRHLGPSWPMFAPSWCHLGPI